MPKTVSARQTKATRQKLTVQLTDEVMDRIDAWRAQQEDKPSREDAIERLLIAHYWPNL